MMLSVPRSEVQKTDAPQRIADALMSLRKPVTPIRAKEQRTRTNCAQYLLIRECLLHVQLAPVVWGLQQINLGVPERVLHQQIGPILLITGQKHFVAPCAQRYIQPNDKTGVI